MIRQQQLAYQQLRLLSSMIRDAANHVAADMGDLNAEEHLYALRDLVDEYDAAAKELFVSGRGGEEVPLARKIQRLQRS